MSSHPPYSYGLRTEGVGEAWERKTPEHQTDSWINRRVMLHKYHLLLSLLWMIDPLQRFVFKQYFLMKVNRYMLHHRLRR
jgi:hypothetical protein